jgi:uncharacterized Tic20 family protein
MTTESMPTTPSQDERIMAGLAHVSAFVPTVGILAPIIIWATQKDKSRYVYVQALQAIVFHLAMLLCFFLGMACYMASFFANFVSFPLTAFGDSSSSPLFLAGFFIPFLVMGLIMLGWVFFIVYSVIAAIMTFQGKDFRYIIIGRMVDRFMQSK